MHPVLFRFPESLPLIGGYAVNSFGMLLYLSFVTAGFVFQRELDRKGLEGERAWDMVLWALVGGLAGAKLYWVLWHFGRLRADPLGTVFSGEGLTWYGGFFLALLLVWLYMRRNGLPVGRAMDAMGPALPAAISVGRIGCFLAGDDYGRPTDSVLGVASPRGFPPTRVEVLERRYGITVDPELVARFGDVVPVHPTQLYEVAISLIVFGVVWSLREHRHRPGWLFAAWVGLYGVQRVVLEIFRIKDDRLFLGITAAQLLSVALVAVALYALIRLSGSPKARRPVAESAGGGGEGP